MIVTYKGYKIEIEQDTDPDSPRSWSNLGTMVCTHKRYDLPNEANFPFDDHESWDEAEEAIRTREDIAIILPLRLYDHSGISMYISGDGGYRQHEAWDSGQVGFIYVSKETLKKEYEVKRISKKILAKTEKILRGEVKMYDQYLMGDIWRYETDEDSCGAFYGYDECLEDAKGIIEANIEANNQKLAQRTKKLIKGNVPVIYR